MAVFFSRRGRRTSYWRDWSSDVCSSDLPQALFQRIDAELTPVHRREHLNPGDGIHVVVLGQPAADERNDLLAGGYGIGSRSEERRVGKESRARGAPGGQITNRSTARVAG